MRAAVYCKQRRLTASNSVEKNRVISELGEVADDRKTQDVMFVSRSWYRDGAAVPRMRKPDRACASPGCTATAAEQDQRTRRQDQRQHVDGAHRRLRPDLRR